MSLKVFLSNLKLARWGILAWSASVFVYALFVMYLYPIISEESLNVAGYINALPEALKAAVGLEGIDVTSSFFTPETYAGTEFLSFWPLMIGIYGIFMGVGIAREAEQGTLDILVAQPVPRYKIISGKFAVFVFSALLIAVASILGFVVGKATIDMPVDFGVLSLVMVEAFLLVMVFGCLTLLCAAVFLKPRQALMVAGMFMGISYILNFVVPALPDSFTWLRNLSVFYHFQPIQIITDAALNWTSVLIYAVISVVCFGGALLVFQRRDLVA